MANKLQHQEQSGRATTGDRPPRLAGWSVLRFEPPRLPTVERRLARCLSVNDLRSLAKKQIPKGAFDFIDGGAEDWLTVHRNRQAFERHGLVPHVLRNVETVSLSTKVVGTDVAMPILLAPAGGTKIVHHAGEIAVARAADRAGCIYAL